MKKKIINDGESSAKAVKFKALDIVILVLILAAVVGVYFRYNILDTLTGSKNLKDYVISFDINDIQYKTEDYINVGDKVYYNNGEELGTLIEADKNVTQALTVKSASVIYVPDGATKAEELFYPENTRIDAKGRMKAQGSYSTDGGFLHNGRTPISIGDKISVTTELVTVQITVTDIALGE